MTAQKGNRGSWWLHGYCKQSNIALRLSTIPTWRRARLLFKHDIGLECSHSRRLITISVYTWVCESVSEWVSDTFAYRSSPNKHVSRFRLSTCLKTDIFLRFGLLSKRKQCFQAPVKKVFRKQSPKWRFCFKRRMIVWVFTDKSGGFWRRWCHRSCPVFPGQVHVLPSEKSRWQTDTIRRCYLMFLQAWSTLHRRNLKTELFLFLRLGLPSTLIRRNCPPKTELFENALENGGIWKRSFAF